jgi:DNA modification methylase
MILSEKWDNFQNKKSFLEFTKQWLDKVMPKLKTTGRAYIFFSQLYEFDLYEILKSNDFYNMNFGQKLIWYYRNNNQLSDRKKYRYCYEPIFYLYGKKAGELNFTADTYGNEQMNVWEVAIPQSNFKEGKMHPAQKPEELYRRIIVTGSKIGDQILDPFAGSGTTGVISKKLKRECILIEKNSEYCKQAERRIANVLD